MVSILLLRFQAVDRRYDPYIVACVVSILLLRFARVVGRDYNGGDMAAMRFNPSLEIHIDVYYDKFYDPDRFQSFS